MSIAKTGTLPDSYKYVNIAVDRFDGRLLQGRIYHDSLGGILWLYIGNGHFAWKNCLMSSRYP